MLRPTLVSAALLSSTAALADVPRVATDIAPVHSLVSLVMGDLGTPDLLVAPGASPHSYAMRPSQARALERADVVFWMGESLSPWLHDPMETLAGDAVQVELLDVEGSTYLDFRESVTFGHDDHDDHKDEHEEEHGHDDHDDHGHDEHHDDEHHDEHDHEAHDDHADEHDDHDHDEHDHEEHDEHADEHGHEEHGHEEHEEHGHDDDHADHDDHEEHDDHGHDEHDDEEHGHDDHAGHDHSGQDPHAWLDPENGKVWLGHIADTLAAADPENAATYQANAAAAQAELTTLVAELEAKLAPVQGTPFVVFHDAYQYFEARFGLSAVGAVRLGDATTPSPAQIADIQHEVHEAGVTCAFYEPQYDAGLLETVFDGIDVTLAEIDPLGVAQTEGPTLYAGLIAGLADSVLACQN